MFVFQLIRLLPALLAIMTVMAVLFLAPPEMLAGQKVIVIDPGHGGQDIGATRTAKMQEKDIVLAFARRLQERLLARRPDYKILLTRENDKDVPLAARVRFARNHKADLFLSLHADWSANAKVRGLAIYSPSAGKPAAIPAIYDADDADDIGETGLVDAILLDFTGRESRYISGKYARALLAAAESQTPLLKRAHRFARFHVITAPEIPSLLVEIGFLSNKADAGNMKNPRWQAELAEKLAEALDLNRNYSYLQE